MTQQALFNQEAPAPSRVVAPKKPRLTGKAKREAWKDLMEQVKRGWEPCDSTWTLIEWISVDLQKPKTPRSSKT